jgi:hypothetical protein
MKIKNLLTTFLHSFIAASIALLLNACGPGTGGTGTGPAVGSGSEPVINPPTVINPPVVVNPPTVTTPVNVIVYATEQFVSGSSASTSGSLPPGIPAASTVDDSRILNGLWSTEDKQGEAYFDASRIVFRKGCAYYEYVGYWTAYREPNSDRTVIETADGYTWKVRLSNGQLAISVTSLTKVVTGTGETRSTDLVVNVLLEDSLLMKAPLPHLKPSPSSVCNR